MTLTPLDPIKDLEEKLAHHLQFDTEANHEDGKRLRQPVGETRLLLEIGQLRQYVGELEDRKANSDAWRQNEMQQSLSVDVDARRRHYDICTHAIDPLGLSIQLERLEKLGVSAKITKRWKDIASAVLHDMLDVSDAIK